MFRLKVAFLTIFIAHALGGSEAFQSTPITQRNHVVDGSTTTQLNVIGPMIRKYKENQAKKKAGMATRDEVKQEAPGLKVGQNVWKWPQVWPYDNNFFTPPEDIEQKPGAGQDINGMASMLSGIAQAQIPVNATDDDAEEIVKLDPLEFWGEQKKEATTDLDPESIEKLKSHYTFYLEDGMSVLELGAAEASYLPDDLKLDRHVGVGANQYLMDKNPALTESLVVDLNKVVPDRDVDNDDLRSLGSEPFDVVIMANTVDYLTRPREVFRTAWYLLKPGGIMITSFSTKEMYGQKFERASTQMWRSYNDDQHMWITGSFYAFSAGDGWDNLLGFDISPESAKEDADGMLNVLKPGKNNNIYVVQAKKATQGSDDFDADNIESSVNAKMWMLPKVEPRDKNLVKNRLVRSIETAEITENIIDIVGGNTQYLPVIYEALSKMDQFAFTFSMQSQLAAELICDPKFTGSEEQMLALRQGLGLRTPSEEFWLPLGTETAAMKIEDKISLLASVVPRFGSGDPEQEQALEAFVTVLKPMFELIRSRLSDISEEDVQLLGTELLVAEVLEPGRSTRMEFANWMSALDDQDLRDYLKARKQIRVDAQQEMYGFQDRRAAAKTAMEERKKKMAEQIDTARKERSMIYNVRTEKFEEFKNK